MPINSPISEQIAPLPGDPNWLPESGFIDPNSERMPTLASMNPFERNQLEQLASKFKLTPATQAFYLENRNVPAQAPLKWYPAKFLQHVSLRIALGVAKGGARIILSAPPRHGKSKLSTEHGPLWVLENFDNKNVVTTTYGADLSEDFARAVRDHMQKNEDVLDVRPRSDANRIAKFLTNKGGALTSIGLGGPITGRGADVLFIDDFIKQIKEANSPAYRDYCWDWLRTTAMTRLEPGASVIIIATRWHHDDLIGRIIREFGTKEEGGEWEYIKYHAIARENDPLGRAPGEALFPQRYSVKTLNERRTLLGSMYYDAIFDQEPHESTSDLTNKEWIIKRKTSEIPVKPYRFVRCWDFAGSVDEKADFTAGGLYCGDKLSGDFGLLNMIKGKWTSGGVEDKVKATAESDGPEVEIVICQEAASAGKAILEHYKNNVLRGYRVTGHYWNTQKEIIAQPWLAACEAGHFWILEASWNEDFIREFESFPSTGSGYHDDQVDTAANAYIRLFGRHKKGGSIGRSSAQTGTTGSKSGSEALPKDPAEAARLLQEQTTTSPNLLISKNASVRFGTKRSKVTFGRSHADNTRTQELAMRARFRMR